MTTTTANWVLGTRRTWVFMEKEKDAESGEKRCERALWKLSTQKNVFCRCTPSRRREIVFSVKAHKLFNAQLRLIVASFDSTSTSALWKSWSSAFELPSTGAFLQRGEYSTTDGETYWQYFISFFFFPDATLEMVLHPRWHTSRKLLVVFDRSLPNLLWKQNWSEKKKKKGCEVKASNITTQM